MLTVYGALMPLRVLEEIRFWKMQEKEHTEVIRALVPNLEPEYVRLLKEWEPVFAQTENTAVQYIEAVVRTPGSLSPYMQTQVEQLMYTSLLQSRLFVSQLSYMAFHSAPIAANPTAQVVVQHIIRESEYFLGVLDSFLARYQITPEIAQQEAYVPYPGEAKVSLSAFEELRTKEEAADREAASMNLTAEGQWSQPPVPDQKPVPIGGHTLPPLPYAYDALEPHIDAETMKLHHDKHHQSYVEGLNKAEKMMAKARQSGDFELIKHWEREAAFNGAGHYLHTIFWNIMKPGGGGKPTGPIAEQINRDFGSFAAFKKHFSEAAEKVEGGGWAILVWSPRSHRLEILQAEKHQNLSQWDVIPLLVLDVWEHAYYLKYKNERKPYIEAWWHTINWGHVNERFSAARMLKWHPY
ncbi:hypothetical protein J31TS4_43600 [Paenibacillus sp. J31TS4]|uniref:Fe-Mn family superoxide dismutase n=1 Tax=Paenibacillus sp. J31TS4 TaxID=2807195 RepID=UPI001B04C838|nr:Fe-Mn family superoxide dismutase [Paenibacillus sp. J31TS4]GIP41080.1 hypothetical protein J31TS4_43600 [Paenibacillus sp. J31TS4]